MSADRAEKNVSEWSFPDVDMFQNRDAEKHVQVQKQAIDKLIQEQVEIKADIERIKNELQHKLTIVNEIFQIIEDPIAGINEEIIKIFHDILRKTTKKIILKEMQTDETVIKNMVGEIRSLFTSEKNKVTVSLSKEDAALFENEKEKLSFVINIDENLNRGDIVAKSKASEIHALLDERINQVINTATA